MNDLEKRVAELEMETYDRRADRVLNLVSTLMLAPEFSGNVEGALEMSFVVVDAVEARCNQDLAEERKRGN